MVQVDTAVTRNTEGAELDTTPTLKNEYVYRAEFVAVGRNRDLEQRALNATAWPADQVDEGAPETSSCRFRQGNRRRLSRNQQADLLANQGTAHHVPLEPDLVWLIWQDFAMKVCRFWRLVGPQLQDRPEEQPRAKLPAEPPVPLPAAPARVPATNAPCQFGEHKRVVKHADFLQCLDCNRQAGKLKATGKYNFAYMRTQDC
eukprot:6488512-Amphidinium_carterae.1